MKIGTVLLNDSVYHESPIKYTIYVGRSGKGKYYNMIFPYKGGVRYRKVEKECVGFEKYIHPIGKTNILKRIVQMIEGELLNYKRKECLEMEYDGCVSCKYEYFPMKNSECQGCKQKVVDKYIKKTNADRIRSMNDKELSEFLYNIDVDECNHATCIGNKIFIDASDIKEWLECECDTW